jgi:hypothetical protein
MPQKRPRTPNTESVSENELLAVKNLGPAYKVIKDHQPSSPMVSINMLQLIIYLTQLEGSFEVLYFEPRWIYKDEYSDCPCLQKTFSKLAREKIDNILNNLYVVDSRKYELLKRLLTGKEIDETIWKDWINLKCKSLPSPGDLGQLVHLIELRESQAKILENHRWIEQMQSSPDDRKLLSMFYKDDIYKGRLCRVYPVNKCRLHCLLDSLSDEQFVRILDIFYSIDSGFYESFKRIITNLESTGDHVKYESIVCSFSSLPW